MARLVKKVVLPGLDFRDLKPLAHLLFPSNLLIPIFFLSAIAQISDNMNSFISVREIQQLFSIRLYSKLLISSLNSNYLTGLYSICKTLSFEVQTLSVLNVKERNLFICSLVNAILYTKGQARIYLKDSLLQDPKLLIKHRRALSIQARSIMSSVPLFSPHSISFGVSVRDISIYDLIDSGRDMWLSLGLQSDDFDFSLRKQALLLYKNLSLENIFSCPISIVECYKILIYSEIRSLVSFHNCLDLCEDRVLLRGSDNLTVLEQNLGFLSRSVFASSLGDVF